MEALHQRLVSASTTGGGYGPGGYGPVPLFHPVAAPNPIKCNLEAPFLEMCPALGLFPAGG